MSELYASQVSWTGNSQIFTRNFISVTWMGAGSYAAQIEGDERVYYAIENGVNFGVGPTVQFETPLDIYNKWNHYPVTVWLMDDGTSKGFENWDMGEVERDDIPF